MIQITLNLIGALFCMHLGFRMIRTWKNNPMSVVEKAAITLILFGTMYKFIIEFGILLHHQL